MFSLQASHNFLLAIEEGGLSLVKPHAALREREGKELVCVGAPQRDVCVFVL